MMTSLRLSIILVILLLYYTPDSIARDNVVDDIEVRFYNGKTIKEFVTFPLANMTKIKKSKGYRKQSKMVFYIHGYEESASSSSVKTVVSAYLSFHPDTNVVVLDWGNMATGSYLNNAARNTDKVGRVAAYYLLELLADGADYKRFHIIANALGCHVAATLGRTTMVSGVTLPRITGLDCAFALYFPAIAGQRLTSKAADFVDVIHTDARMQGMPLSFAHADFWPNNGRRLQPGCPEINIFVSLNADTFKAELCSHDRAWVFYAESVKTPQIFWAVKCSNNGDFMGNKCANRSKAYMGFGVSSLAKGDYYLRTNDKAPYGLRERGIRLK